MPNANYRSGAAAERDVKKILESEGWTATRSAGSHGKWDVIAYNGETILLIQVKVGSAAPTADERAQMIASAVPKYARKELWTRKKGKWEREQL